MIEINGPLNDRLIVSDLATELVVAVRLLDRKECWCHRVTVQTVTSARPVVHMRFNTAGHTANLAALAGLAALRHRHAA